MTSPADTSHRIHIAANDPAFPAKREAAIAAILASISAVALAEGYFAKPQSWVKSGPRGTASLRLQRGAYGWDCKIILGFQTVSETPSGLWADEDEVDLGLFFLPDEGVGGPTGVITYLDVHDDPACLKTSIEILKTRALPWLNACLSDPGNPEIQIYLPR